MKIFYVVDDLAWVQRGRVELLRRFQDQFQFQVLSQTWFKWLWRFGFLRKRFIFFSNWRIVHKLQKENPHRFKPSDFAFFLAAVTSHTNIGGGLNPQNALRGRTPEEGYRLATELLKKFKVITANSITLQKLLEPALPQVAYCPNGVDADFFKPLGSRKFDPQNIRLGWVGRDRGAKNFETLTQALEVLKNRGFEPKILLVKKDFQEAPLDPAGMRDYYQEIDFYLCTSWNEGTPNPGLEAASCGKPIISTRVGNMCELIENGKNGFFIDPTVDSVVQVCMDLKKLSSSEYAEMGRIVRHSILKAWTWDKQVQGFVRALERLTS